MTKEEAYGIVFNDLVRCNLFTGIYDAKNGKRDFMFGIATIMEFIAYNVSPNTYNDFNSLFYKNMTTSEKKVDKSTTPCYNKARKGGKKNGRD